MNNNIFKHVLQFAMCLLVMATSNFAAGRPNIVVILVDDMGWYEWNNVALQQPDRVAAMSAQYDTWAKRTRVATEDDSNQSIDTAKKKKKGQNGAKKKSPK